MVTTSSLLIDKDRAWFIALISWSRVLFSLSFWTNTCQAGIATVSNSTATAMVTIISTRVKPHPRARP